MGLSQGVEHVRGNSPVRRLKLVPVQPSHYYFAALLPGCSLLPCRKGPVTVLFGNKSQGYDKDMTRI